MPEYSEVGGKWYLVLHPRPAYIIVVGGEAGVNLMAASWVQPLSEEPPRVVVALDKESYTYELIGRGSRDFTVNVLPVESYEYAWRAGSVSGREVGDKARAIGVELTGSSRVAAPRLAKPEPLGWVECRVARIIDDVAEDVALVIGDVVAAYARSDLFTRFGWGKSARILMHLSGRAFTTNCGFYLARG